MTNQTTQTTTTERKPQSQESLTAQLGQLVVIASKEGLYDAADFILNVMKGQIRR